MDCISTPPPLSFPPSFYPSPCTSYRHCQASVVAGCLFRYHSPCLFLYSALPFYALRWCTLIAWWLHSLSFCLYSVSCPNPSCLLAGESLSSRGGSFAVSASICLIPGSAVSGLLIKSQQAEDCFHPAFGCLVSV